MRSIPGQLMSAFSAIFLLAAGGNALAQPQAAHRPAMHAVVMGMTSTAFPDGGILPDRYTMKAGSDAPSPQLSWTGAPAGTKSFTLIMHDLDVVLGKGTGDNLHWLAFNIPAGTHSLTEGVPNRAELPDGTIQPDNRGRYGYTPPGAPPGVYHHYVITVYALDDTLKLGPTATRDQVMAAMAGHVLDKATIVARFHR